MFWHMSDKSRKGYPVMNDKHISVAQKNRPPIVVTRSIGGQICYTRTEFSERVGVHVSTLRVWEKKKMLVPAYIDSDDIRYYTEEQARQYLKANQKGKHHGRRI